MAANHDVSAFGLRSAVPVLPDHRHALVVAERPDAVPSAIGDDTVETGRDRVAHLGREPGRALHLGIDGGHHRAELTAGQPGAALGHRVDQARAGTACRRWRRRRRRSASCSGVTSTSPCPTARLALSPRRQNWLSTSSGFNFTRYSWFGTTPAWSPSPMPRRFAEPVRAGGVLDRVADRVLGVGQLVAREVVTGAHLGLALVAVGVPELVADLVEVHVAGDGERAGEVDRAEHRVTRVAPLLVVAEVEAAVGVVRPACPRRLRGTARSAASRST